MKLFSYATQSENKVLLKSNYNRRSKIKDFDDDLIENNYNHWHEIVDFDNGLISKRNNSNKNFK